jgi:hypothetical protein
MDNYSDPYSDNERGLSWAMIIVFLVTAVVGFFAIRSYEIKKKENNVKVQFCQEMMGGEQPFIDLRIVSGYESENEGFSRDFSNGNYFITFAWQTKTIGEYESRTIPTTIVESKTTFNVVPDGTLGYIKPTVKFSIDWEKLLNNTDWLGDYKDPHKILDSSSFCGATITISKSDLKSMTNLSG